MSRQSITVALVQSETRSATKKVAQDMMNDRRATPQKDRSLTKD